MFWSELASECGRVVSNLVAQWRGQRAAVRRVQVMPTVGPPNPPLMVYPNPVIQIAPPDVECAASMRVIVGPGVVIPIRPPTRAVWDERGWRATTTSTSTIYEGEYITNVYGTTRRFSGRIVERGKSIATYIADPPSAIRDHPKGQCFQLATPPWFRVHWHRAATNVDDALLYVEQILDEALN